MPMEEVQPKFQKEGTEVVFCPRHAWKPEDYCPGVIIRVLKTRVTARFKRSDGVTFTEQFKASTWNDLRADVMHLYGGDTFRSPTMRLAGDPWIDDAKDKLVQQREVEDLRTQVIAFSKEMTAAGARELAGKLLVFAANREERMANAQAEL